ncbi:pyridine nucleotide-disulfide oxidoreductase/dicluster-binding protein [Pseudodesulfovibrio portus]|nr:pyridine nucleotide-disulfide oxidoreductase/dicluster-binding protein [Pseudodesulfovibrio portus]
MDQSELRRLESRCVQEEAPRCTASCPLHVDVKGFCALMAQRRFDKAWSVLAKTLPLPGVLVRLCDGPCKGACVRKDAGGAVEIDALERACAALAKSVRPPKPLPSRHKSVAVVGGTLTGLCAAWEMARRGFDVTLYCEQAGSCLSAVPESTLPGGVLANEMEALRAMGADMKENVSLTPELLDSLLEEKDAVFIDSDDLPEDVRSFGQPDEITLGTERAGLFASRTGEPSAVFQAATGRRAANSIERFTQGVSMVSGRELEGPYETRLFTSLDKVEPLPPTPSDGVYAEVEARDEAKRCLQCECMECVKTCEYLRHYKYYPKVYARQIYNNESIVMGTRQANTMINSCMLCGLCETVCPEDFSMGDVCLEARRSMVERGKMPPSAHDFALRDMAFANGERCALARHAPGTDASEYVFFPGCQLTASDPDGVETAYGDLRERLGNVGLMLHCCGAPADWSGRVGLFEEAMAELKSVWESLGSPKIIAACPTCIKTLRVGLPDAEIVSHWSVLRALGVPVQATDGGGTLAISDPCAARHDRVLREDVRALLEQANVSLVEPELTGEYTECCGFGGLLSEANPELGRKVAERRAGAREEDFVTYCAMCRDMIARTGKRALHLYDLLYPKGDSPAARPSPGYSARRENRVRLRETLLRGLWQEDAGPNGDPFEAIEVAFSDQAAANMEDRRILKSDVQKVLLHVGRGGQRFVHGETGHFLSAFRPVVVTYWVEFEERDGGYYVHNTWSHRMHIKGERS